MINSIHPGSLLETDNKDYLVALESGIHLLQQIEQAVILIPFADISSRNGEKTKTGMYYFQPKVVETQCILSFTAIKMINCLCGPGEPGKSTVRTL